MNGMRTPIYLYIDEAGNFDFSPKGSKFLTLTCAAMRRPFGHIDGLASLKYDCLESGVEDKAGKKYHEFHAAEDRQALRDKVFGIIGSIDGLGIYSIALRKNKTNPSLHPSERLYAKAFGWLIEDAIKGECIDASNHAIVVLDSINMKGKNDALKASLMQQLDAQLVTIGADYKLYQHQSCSDFNLQVVDYCSWAIQRRLERNDNRSYALIHEKVKHVGDPFFNGDTVYYTFSR